MFACKIYRRQQLFVLFILYLSPSLSLSYSPHLARLSLSLLSSPSYSLQPFFLCLTTPASPPPTPYLTAPARTSPLVVSLSFVNSFSLPSPFTSPPPSLDLQEMRPCFSGSHYCELGIPFHPLKSSTTSRRLLYRLPFLYFIFPLYLFLLLSMSFFYILELVVYFKRAFESTS